ncbi:AMP-binding protein [Roseovarius sp. EGI FJ00037]|uniref:AMP-binding protein n=1 Tax=Roseovarius TaxID=74030 RepID=UPI0022A76866|nr:AMP-binding protein [Roseovarius sp. EGI FJ00037]MCZ0811251.1 AMP-binding protein [Roseovarius sp. EGI FJ00037]
MTAALKTVAIEASNSLDFLKHAFRLYESGAPFTVQRAGLDLSHYPGLEITERLATFPGGGWGQHAFTRGMSDAPAQILFSSGTEGRPKPIVLSQRNISDVVTRLNAAMQPDETIREYIGVPVTYSFGLGRVRAVSAVGGRFFLPERFDPVEIREMLERGEINAISAVPTLWRIVLGAPDAIGDAGQAVKWIEIGSQYMSGDEKLALKALFPNARIVQHYGLTEASRSTFLNVSRSDDALLESVGTASPPSEVRIGSKGEICIRGDHVALGVLNDAGGIDAISDSDGWLHTKDKGAIRDGALYYLGRLDDQMNIAGVNVNAENLERAIIELCGCEGRIAVGSVSDPLRGDAALIAVDDRIAERAPLIEKAAELALKASGVDQSGCVRIFAVDAIPVTGTGKIQRRKLRALYAAQGEVIPAASGREAHDDRTLTPSEAKVAEAWRKVAGARAITRDDTFYDVGGDSLSAVQIGLVMERQFDRGTVRATLEGRTLSEVAATEDAAGTGDATGAPATAALPERTTATWSINITRAIMAIAVLFAHWGPGFFERLGIAQEVNYYLGGFMRMGTEGFATVFGVGLGFFFLPAYGSDPASVHKRLRISFLLVLSGLGLLGAVHLVLLMIEGQAITGLSVARAFYNILAYYVLAFATAAIWLRYLNGGQSVIFRALVVVVLALPVTWAMRAILPDQQLNSILEWPRLMAVAGYSYFQLSALVFGGIAIGHWYSRQDDLCAASKALAVAGGCGMALSMTVGLDVLPPNSFATGSSPFFLSLLGYVFYFFATVFLVGIFDLLLRHWNGLGRTTRAVLQILIVTGGLALPIYAFHGIVIPLKDILLIAGLPGAVALVLPIGAFIAVMIYLGWRLRRMYFG